MKIAKSLTLTLTFLALFSCAPTFKNGMDLPELNTTKLAVLETRGDSNYKQACLFLTNYDKKQNDPAILLQNSDDINGTQVTDDIAIFTSLISGSNHEISAQNKGFILGDTIQANNYQVGDEYMLEKEDTEDRFVMTFKILEVNPGQNIKIEYQVKSYELKAKFKLY